MANADPQSLRIQVACSLAPREVQICDLNLPPGSTLADALRQSGWQERLGERLGAEFQFGVWTKARPPETLLRDQDRVEIWRPLKVDPKEARRQRYHKQPKKR